MRVITAPASLKYDSDEPSVFLAGGITNCPWWQDEVIKLLEGEQGVIFNPRRRVFPIGDPDAAQQQISWEFYALEHANIFSMWFCAGESDQPICMYELGRHLALSAELDMLNRVVIGVEPGYRREQDVRIQTGMVSPMAALNITSRLEDHAIAIAQAIRELQGES